MKKLILCADDFGQNIAISDGIIELINQERLSATSCMTNMPDWPQCAQNLKPLLSKVDVGLHFNLTEGKSLGRLAKLAPDGHFPALGKLLGRSLIRALDKQEIVTELNLQIDQFAEHLGKLPDFIDGHQHIHQFPVIRTALLEVYEQRLRKNASYIRSTRSKKFTGVKQFIVYLLGGRRFERLLQQYNIPHNTTFAGFYDFNKMPNYSHLFPEFLHNSADNGLIMCHPGQASEDKTDPIAANRYPEFQYFMSTQFLEDCKAAGVELSRM